MPDAKEVEKGNWIFHNNELYLVKRKEVVVFGTHSHSKVKLFLQSIKGSSEKAFVFSNHHRLDVVDLVRKTGQLISKFENKAQLMDSYSYETFDITLDNEMANNLNEGDEVIFIDFKGDLSVLGKK